jgi:chromosome segregation ATPase
MINIPLFKEQIEQKLQSDNHDMKWLARKVKADEVALQTILNRKSMKYSTYVLKDISKLLDIEIPKMDEPNIKVDKEPAKKAEPIEPVPEEKPTLIDDLSEPLAEINEPEIWLGGRKYTKEDILKMTAESVEDHRKIVELTDELDKVKEELAGYEEDYKDISDKYEILEHDYQTKTNQHLTALAEIDKLNKDIQELTDKYTAKDKECMKYGIMVNDLHAEIDELKDAEPIELESLTIAQGVQFYRTLKRLFTDEVLK